jgi:hypothetical protein
LWELIDAEKIFLGGILDKGRGDKWGFSSSSVFNIWKPSFSGFHSNGQQQHFQGDTQIQSQHNPGEANLVRTYNKMP